jgi:hypothetical protein
MRLPDFFVIGAPKTASTSLFVRLRRTPGFALEEPKEPGFFCYERRDFIVDAHARRMETLPYLLEESEFSKAYGALDKAKLFGDFTTHYLYFASRFVNRIQHYYGAAARTIPIVVVLRDPVERAYSHYAMKARDGHESLPFEEAIEPLVIERRLADGFVPSFDYIGFSAYAERLERIRSAFDHVLVLDYRDLIGDPRKALLKLAEHLSVPLQEPEESAPLDRLNASGFPSDAGLRRWAHAAIYRPNPLKAAIPARMRRALAGPIKQVASRVLLEGRPIESQALRRASQLLAAEAAYYEAQFPPPPSNPKVGGEA